MTALRSSPERELDVRSDSVAGAVSPVAAASVLDDESDSPTRNVDFPALLDTLPVLIALFDLQQRFLFSNRAHQRWWGRSLDELVGKHLREVIGEANYREALPYVLQALNGKTAMYEAHVTYRGMGRRYVTICYAPLFGANQRVEGVSVHVQDLTAKKAALDAQQDLSARYQRLYADAPVMLHSIDRSGNLISVSSYWLETLGYSREEVLGRPITDFMTPESQRYAREVAFPEFFASGFVRDVPYQFVTRDGRVLDVLLSAVQERKPDGEMLRSLSVVIDVTAQRHAERRSHDLEAQLRHAHKMEALGTLAGGIAHDFNNILAGILGYLELAALELGENGIVRDFVGQAQSSAERAKELVKRILTFSKRRSSERQLISLGFMMSDLVSLIRATFPSTIEIVTKLPQEEVHVEADATELHQVFLNICTNAEHAMREHGGVLRIDVSAVTITEGSMLSQRGLKSGNWAKVTIADSGVGMSEEVRDRVFEPYFTTKGVGEGSGLGLSVAHGIVAAFGGTILVQSMAQLGTSFDVFLPLASSPPSERREPVLTSLAPGSGRILIVDDEETIAELGRQMLQTLGYRVTACTKTADAVALLESDPNGFDLVITDQTMPGMTGDRLARFIGTLRPDLPVILCTGYMADAEVIEIGGSIRAVLPKPYSLIDLSRLVTQLVEPGPEKEPVRAPHPQGTAG